MRNWLAKSTAVAALVSALAFAGTASASAASTSCTSSGTVKLSPGLTATPKVQNITVKGKLSECAGEESSVTGGTFTAHLKTTEAVGCSVLTGEGVTEEESKIVIKWSPKGQKNSIGTFSMPLTELPVALGGVIASGPFVEGAISGSATQAYAGSAECGVAKGKKKAKAVNKGSFNGTLAVS